MRRGREADFAKIFQEKILPSALKETGLRRLYLLRPVARAATEFVIFSLWESEKDAEEYVNSGNYKGYVSRYSDLLEEEPVVSKFVVDVHAVGGSVNSARRRKRRRAR